MTNKVLSVSFVIIEYHSLSDIQKCVQSIVNHSDGVTYEIIVSSNSMYSLDRQVEIEQTYVDVKWLFNSENGGFAYGMNKGIKKSNGRNIVIINPDVEICDGLKSMIDYFDSNPTVGAIAPQIVNSVEKIQDSCRKQITFISMVKRNLQRIFKVNESGLDKMFDYNVIQRVDWLIGAFIMVKRSVYLAVGGLDEGYFMYAEDVDWCTRITKAGYKIIYFPNMKIYYQGDRKARAKLKYAIYFIKSHMRFFNKYGWF